MTVFYLILGYNILALVSYFYPNKAVWKNFVRVPSFASACDSVSACQILSKADHAGWVNMTSNRCLKQLILIQLNITESRAKT